jgi:hypothetical protein
MPYTAKELIKELIRAVNENPELEDQDVTVSIDGSESSIESVDLWAAGGIQLQGEE